MKTTTNIINRIIFFIPTLLVHTLAHLVGLVLTMKNYVIYGGMNVISSKGDKKNIHSIYDRQTRLLESDERCDQLIQALAIYVQLLKEKEEEMVKIGNQAMILDLELREAKMANGTN